MDNAKKYAVRKKIYDSIIILTDILNIGISHLKDDMEYILVYNETVNQNELDVRIIFLALPFRNQQSHPDVLLRLLPAIS